MVRKCNTCGLRDPAKNVCLLSGRTIDPAADFCSSHLREPPRCAECGKITLSPIFENEQTFCSQCAEAITTCFGCSLASNCAFETDPSPIPKVVVKTVRQGPMVTQTQVRNPDRIAITCKLNCHCWNGEYCGREDNWCSKYSSRHPVGTCEEVENLSSEEN
jgi:hypothetical protein